jgi:hypothetical protein
MDNKERAIDEKCSLGRGPIVFAGAPTSCQGYVELINQSTEDVEPKAIAITKLEPNPGQRRLPAPARVSVRLGPHQRVCVPIEVALDPTTPPGSYTGQLSCGSQTEDIVVNVLENWDLRILPGSVNITASPGERVALRVLFTNLGNTDITLPSSLSLYLEDKLEIGRYLNAALKTASKQGYEKFLDRFVEEMAEAAVGTATVHFKTHGAKFRSGENRQVELQIQLPEDLKKNRVYKGLMKFKNARVVLEVECTESPDVSQRRKK